MLPGINYPNESAFPHLLEASWLCCAAPRRDAGDVSAGCGLAQSNSRVGALLVGRGGPTRCPEVPQGEIDAHAMHHLPRAGPSQPSRASLRNEKVYAT